MLGVPVSITSPARTVVDCFRYRNKLGLDTALEALRDALHRRIATVDEIMRAAGACRARTVLEPYVRSGTVVTPRTLRNVGASARARLLARSRETGEDFPVPPLAVRRRAIPLPP